MVYNVNTGTSGWAKKKASACKSLHFFDNINGPSLCRMANAGESVLDNPDDGWKCQVCKAELKKK